MAVHPSGVRLSCVKTRLGFPVSFRYFPFLSFPFFSFSYQFLNNSTTGVYTSRVENNKPTFVFGTPKSSTRAPSPGFVTVRHMYAANNPTITLLDQHWNP